MGEVQVFTISEIAKMLRIDRHKATELFERENGVIVIGNRETQRGRRKYRSIRVPVAVYNRVIARITNH